jgi:hypothetical protein
MGEGGRWKVCRFHRPAQREWFKGLIVLRQTMSPSYPVTKSPGQKVTRSSSQNVGWKNEIRKTGFEAFRMQQPLGGRRAAGEMRLC